MREAGVRGGKRGLGALIRGWFLYKNCQKTGHFSSHVAMWSMDLFLEMNQKDEQFENRMLIMDIFDEFLERSGRCIKNI